MTIFNIYLPPFAGLTFGYLAGDPDYWRRFFDFVLFLFRDLDFAFLLLLSEDFDLLRNMNLYYLDFVRFVDIFGV